VDIKPKRDYPNETVFVFELNDSLLDSIEDWLNVKDSYEEYKYGKTI
jgi:hypothetical protein